MCEIMKCMRYLVCGISSVWDERRRGRGREVKEGRRRRHCSNNKNPILRIWGIIITRTDLNLVQA